MTWWKQLTTVAHPNPHIRRRGRLLSIVLIAVLILAIVFIPVTLFGPTPVLGIITIAVSIAIFIACLVLAHRGRVNATGWLFVLMVIVMPPWI
ncbi:hypothetical protein SD80_011700 [Scytonema tolypothrichoides VB-61278]|nr:hypothetical protein SD80_011700 [Scytonema tolypothrichoides VB-61278]